MEQANNKEKFAKYRILFKPKKKGQSQVQVQSLRNKERNGKKISLIKKIRINFGSINQR